MRITVSRQISAGRPPPVTPVSGALSSLLCGGTSAIAWTLCSSKEGREIEDQAYEVQVAEQRTKEAEEQAEQLVTQKNVGPLDPISWVFASLFNNFIQGRWFAIGGLLFGGFNAVRMYSLFRSGEGDPASSMVRYTLTLEQNPPWPASIIAED